MNEPIRWLLVEGIAALFGAGGLYLLVGLCFTIAGSGVPFAWREAFDPMGWLYGTLVIGIQTSVRLLNAPITRPVLAAICISLTAFCCVQLIAAMHLRGSKAGWAPQNHMKLIAGALAMAILLVGFLSRGT